MNVLLAAATAQEIKPFLDHFRKKGFKKHEVDVLITGVGLMATTYSLCRQIALKQPDLVIQAGIAGCFDKKMPLGSLVAIKQDRVADEGVIESGNFKTVIDLKLVRPNHYPYKNGWLVNKSISKYGIRSVNAISVNQVTTDSRQIKEYIVRYKAMVESMEGAALHYVCLQEKISFLQLRGISNYIGERNKAKWDFQKPIENLNKAIITMLEK